MEERKREGKREGRNTADRRIKSFQSDGRIGLLKFRGSAADGPRREEGGKEGRGKLEWGYIQSVLEQATRTWEEGEFYI